MLGNSGLRLPIVAAAVNYLRHVILYFVILFRCQVFTVFLTHILTYTLALALANTLSHTLTLTYKL